MKVKEVQLKSFVLTESTETALCWFPLRHPHPPSEGALVLWAWRCSSTYRRRSISIRVQFLSIFLYFPEFPLLREPYLGGTETLWDIWCMGLWAALSSPDSQTSGLRSVVTACDHISSPEKIKKNIYKITQLHRSISLWSAECNFNSFFLMVWSFSHALGEEPQPPSS